MAHWLHQGQWGSSSFKTFMILKSRSQSSLERTGAGQFSILCKPLLCLAGRGLLLFQASFLRLSEVLVEMTTIGSDTGVFESRVAFIRFHFHPSLSRQRYDHWKKNDHEAEVPYEFTELAKCFELVACSVPGIDMAELPAQSLSSYLRVEHYRVVRKWSFLKLLSFSKSAFEKTYISQNLIYTQSTSYPCTLKINKWLNWNTEYCKALFLPLFSSPRLPCRPLMD